MILRRGAPGSKAGSGRMGIRCPGCGRHYDLTLFAFGRTIHCTCGQRVGAEPPPRPSAGADHRFIADAMLGRLARWLRILGFDTAYKAHISDADLVRRAARESRVILSRDRLLLQEWSPRLTARGTPSQNHIALYLVEADRPLEQLREVAGHFQLGAAVRMFTRCSRCNVLLLPATRDEARQQVPPRILNTEEPLTRCPLCQRFYWSGSHVQRVLRIVRQSLQEPFIQ